MVYYSQHVESSHKTSRERYANKHVYWLCWFSSFFSNSTLNHINDYHDLVIYYFTHPYFCAPTCMYLLYDSCILVEIGTSILTMHCYQWHFTKVSQKFIQQLRWSFARIYFIQAQQKIHLLWSRPVLAVRYRYTIVSHSALVIKIHFLCKLCSILAYWWQLLCFANFNVHDEFQLNLNSLRSHNNGSILTVDLFCFKVSNWYLSTKSRYQYPNSPKFFHSLVFLSKILEN